MLRQIFRLSRKSLRSPLLLWLDPENYSITRFMKFAAKQVSRKDKVLDAGAGSCPYEKLFSHAKYESCDFEDIFDKKAKNRHDFICDLVKIPRKNGHYNVILNTQVLEHVPDPQKVLNEFFRLLKKGGKLFLTAPQGWGIHGEPYHFFNFTKYGLKLLLERAGFKIIFIKPRGGFFWYLSKRLSTMPLYIFSQYVLEQGKSKLRISFGALILFPFCILSHLVFTYITPLILLPLDFLDRKKDYTLGYACYCKK